MKLPSQKTDHAPPACNANQGTHLWRALSRAGLAGAGGIVVVDDSTERRSLAGSCLLHPLHSAAMAAEKEATARISPTH